MLKNNKKTFIMIGVYTALLLAVVGMFLFFQNTNNKNAITYVYMTTQPIQAGETVDDSLIANKVSKTEYQISAVKEMEEHGAHVVTSPMQISSLIAIGRIPAGQVLTKEFFEAITPEIYGDYTNKTFAKNTSNEWKFINPDYIILSVNQKNTPINGFTKGEEISIEGYSKFTHDITLEDKTETAEGVYSGILTNHAVIHNLIYDEKGALSYIGVIVEQSKYPLISTIAKNGELIFHSGYTEAWETTTNEQYNQLLLGEGIYSRDVIEAPTVLSYTTKNNEYVERIMSDFSKPGDYDTEVEMYPSFIRTQAQQVTNKYDVVLTTPYPHMTIVHYNLDGTAGQYMDATGLNTDKNYNSKTGLYTITFAEDYAEGYYEIEFGTKDTTGASTMCQKICFIIEQDDYAIEDSDKLTLNLNFLTAKDSYGDSEEETEFKNLMDVVTSSATAHNPEAGIYGNYYGYAPHSIFDGIAKADVTITTSQEEIKNNEMILNNYTTSYTDANNLPTTIITKPNGVASGYVIKNYNNFELDGEYFTIKLRFNEETKEEDINATGVRELTALYTYSGCEVLDIAGNDTVKSGTKLKVNQILRERYSNYAIQLGITNNITDEMFEKTKKEELPTTGYIAYVKETDNYQKALFSKLMTLSDNDSIINFSGYFKKTYFDNLLVRGINLAKTIENASDMNYNNLFNATTSYGTFGNEAIKNVSLVMNAGSENELKIQLFYTFNGSRYIATPETRQELAEALGVDSKAIEKALYSARLSETDVRTIINTVLSKEVVASLNENKNDTEDLLKLIGFLFTNSAIDFSNLYTKEVEGGYVKMFHSNDIVLFIEALNVELELSNGEKIMTNIHINY